MKKLILSIFFGLLILIPIKTNAASVNVSLNCPTSANKGETISCKVNVTSDVFVNGVAANYALKNVTYVSFTPSNGFTANYTSSNGFAIGNNNGGKKGTYQVGLLKVKVTEAGSVTLQNIDVSDTNIESYTPSNKTSNIRINSTNNYLKTLTANQGNINFNKTTTSYSLNVDENISSIQIGATLEDNTSSFVSGYGPRIVNLNYGKNAIQIKVKAESGDIRTYTINVNRKDNRSSNNYLKSLNIENNNISFNKNTLEYNLVVNYEINTLNITALPEDSKSKVVISNKNLNVGNNIITITVTSENTQKRIYKLNVNRLQYTEKPSDNNNVKSIRVLGHEFDYKESILEYELNIKDEYALVFEIDLEDSKAKYEVEGNKDLKDGSVIKVISTSESGEIKEYKFNINKKEEIKESSSNNILYYVLFGVGGFILGASLVYIVTKKKKNQ